MKIKKIIFSILAVLLPLAFLALVELTLWVMDAYPQPPLFREITEEDTTYIQINSQVGERYFNKHIMPVPSLYPQKFSKEKGVNTLRVFCLGGSTTAGFPYEMTVPFPQQLALLLKADYPDREFEIINMGLSAINSFTVVDWMPEILQQDPDLILLYLGHNEFYGAYGTGSTISLGHDGRIVRLILKLQKFRVGQLINSLVRVSTDLPASKANLSLMEKAIESNSVLRIKTRENFSANLNVILKASQSAGVPIILSNLVSNIKDQVPLDMTSNPEQTSSKAHKLYLKGLREFRQGDTTTAYISLTRAKNNDQVPFRGNDYLNEILQVKAGRYGQGIVDMKTAFRRASPSGIPGNDLFCDHLHPNPLGQHVMAREFFSAINAMGLLPPIEKHELPLEPLFVTDLDWEIGALKVFKHMHSWPFSGSSVDYSLYTSNVDDETVQIAKDYLFHHNFWDVAHRNMANHFLEKGEFEKACNEYLAIIEMFPRKTKYYTNLVESAKQANMWGLVEQTCQKALTMTSSKGMFYYNMALAQKITGNMELAMISLQGALTAPEISATQAAKINFTHAEFLLDLHKPSEAAAVLTELVREVPDFLEAQELLNKLMN